SADAGELVPGTTFRAYETDDALGRRIQLYVSEPAAEAKPLALLVPGSGCSPIFHRAGPDRVSGGYQNPLLAVGRGRLRVMVVERPGAEAFGPARGGTAEGCPTAFLEEHTLERWSEALRAALAFARGLSGIDRRRTLVIGHSEGAVVAAYLARLDRELSHV